MALTRDEVLSLTEVQEAIARGFIEIKGDRVSYKVSKPQSQNWRDPEEWVRCAVVAYLIVEKGYPPERIAVEVPVPRRIPGDFADVVVFRDRRCKVPYLVVETKAEGQSAKRRRQAIEQAIGNANSLKVELALYDEWSESELFDTSGTYGAMEREENRRGDRSRVPEQYSTDERKYRFMARLPGSDIEPATPSSLEAKVRRTHSIIWSGGKRDPLTSFDEWSKLLFAKVHDERNTPNGKPRRFQAGSGETATAVANRVHELFANAKEQDKYIIPPDVRINLSDQKIYDIVKVLEDISIVDTDVDTIGAAFERFFGSVFRGELGQYFTMRPIARFTVSALDIDHDCYVLDPTAGSGGFLLETLLQVWQRIDEQFAGPDLQRKRIDFAMQQVYGIEIHEILARILKINLLLHHDGHTNIEGDRSCLDTEFSNPRLATSRRAGFHRIVGNPPFGDTVKAGDVDLLGKNDLETFQVAKGRTQVPSEQIILEQSIEMLKDGGRLGFVLPDGLFNNQGEQSNCPRVRRYLAANGVIEAVVSLPDFAFRKSGAQNKTSILIYRKFTPAERARWNSACRAAMKGAQGDSEEERAAAEEQAVLAGLRALDYRVFMAEASHIGYTSTGQKSERNELFRAATDTVLAADQSGTVLGEIRRFRKKPASYNGHRTPDCIAMSIVEIWTAHSSHRLDPKYFLFKREEKTASPAGWVRTRISEVMRRREERVAPEENPEQAVTVLTVSQTGDLRPREAGKGRNPPEWLGMYFEEMPTAWYRACAKDVVFSGIDLWKGCIAVVPDEFDGSLVSKEFPVYEVTDQRLDPDFLSTLLRSRYYRRAFRAITTGHSNRRRTQEEDFENLEITFPPSKKDQRKLIAEVIKAARLQRGAQESLKQSMLAFSDVIDHRGDEEYEFEEDSAEELGT